MSDSDVGMGGENQGKGKKGWDVAGFIPRAILAFLWNPLSGATPFRKKKGTYPHEWMAARESEWIRAWFPPRMSA